MTNLVDRLREVFEDVRCDSEDYAPLLQEVAQLEGMLASRGEPGAPQLSEPFTVSEHQVTRITTAYESGYGRGESNRDLSQPYRAGCAEALAYYQGWLRGCLCNAENRPAEPALRRAEKPCGFVFGLSPADNRCLNCGWKVIDHGHTAGWHMTEEHRAACKGCNPDTERG